MKSNSKEFIKKLLNKSINATGTLTALATIFIYGITGTFLPVYTSLHITLAAFGLIGFLEVFHRQRAALVKNKCKSIPVNEIFERALEAKKIVHPIVFKEFTHHNVFYRVFTVKGSPCPIGITQPLCPACHHNLLESVKVIFPGRIKIIFSCPACNNSFKSKYTFSEITQEAALIAGIPQ